MGIDPNAVVVFLLLIAVVLLFGGGKIVESVMSGIKSFYF